MESVDDDVRRTPLQAEELKALTGDRNSVLRVVSALREYREAVYQLQRSRDYNTGQTTRERLSELRSRTLFIENLVSYDN